LLADLPPGWGGFNSTLDQLEAGQAVVSEQNAMGVSIPHWIN